MQIPSHTDVQITPIFLFLCCLSPGSNSRGEALMTFTKMAHSIAIAERQVTIDAPSGYGASLLSLATGNIWYWCQQRDHKTEEFKVTLLLLIHPHGQTQNGRQDTATLLLHVDWQKQAPFITWFNRRKRKRKHELIPPPSYTFCGIIHPTRDLSLRLRR